MPTPSAHSHYIRTTTQGKGKEQHPYLVQAFTFPVNGTSKDGHVHSYKGFVPGNNGQKMYFMGKTGPAIPLPDGSHIHEVSGSIFLDPQGNEPLSHWYETLTGRPVGEAPSWW